MSNDFLNRFRKFVLDNTTTTYPIVFLSLSCSFCGSITVIHVIYKDYLEYISNNYKHVQDIFPYLNSGERELLISGMCNSCFPM